MLLTEQHCSAQTDSSLLTEKERIILLKQIPQWSYSENSAVIIRSYAFKDYYQTLSFINTIAKIIHTENHHPQISFGYNNCTIHYTTHSAGGVTLFDLICAAYIEESFLHK